jgi:hypothetical protein
MDICLLDHLTNIPEIKKIVRVNQGFISLLFDYQGLQIACGIGNTEAEAIDALVVDEVTLLSMIEMVEADPDDFGQMYDVNVLRSCLPKE